MRISSSRILVRTTLWRCTEQTISLKPCRDRASGQQVASLSASLFARSFGGAGCSHLQTAFLREEGGTSYASDGRSLRNSKICAILTVTHSPSVAVGASSLSEGASEMFAAVMFGSCRLFATAAASHRPTNVEYCSAFRRDDWFVPFVCNGQPRTSVPTMNNGCLIRILASIYVRSYKKPSPVGEGGSREADE